MKSAALAIILEQNACSRAPVARAQGRTSSRVHSLQWLRAQKAASTGVDFLPLFARRGIIKDYEPFHPHKEDKDAAAAAREALAFYPARSLKLIINHVVIKNTVLQSSAKIYTKYAQKAAALLLLVLISAAEMQIFRQGNYFNKTRSLSHSILRRRA